MIMEIDIERTLYGPKGLEPFFWPVDRFAVMPARDMLTSNLMPLLRSQGDDPVAFVARLFPKWFLVEVMNVYYASSIIQAFHETDVGLVVPPRFKLLTTLLKGRKPCSQMFMRYARWPERPERLYYPKKILRELQWNRRPLKLLVPFDSESDVLMVVPTPQTLLRARYLKRYLRFSNLRSWFSPVPPEMMIRPAGVEHSSAFSSLMDLVAEAFDAGGQAFPGWGRSYVAGWCTQAFNFAAWHLERLRKNRSSLPQELWGNSVMTQVWLRLLAFVIRENGGRVVVNEHGTGNPHFDQTVTHFSAYTGCDEFCASSRASREMKIRTIRPELFYSGKPPQITSLPEKGRGSSAGAPPSSKLVKRHEKIHKIMYVPTAFHGERGRPLARISDVAYLDWQARLLGFLASLGMKVVVQPHPEGQSKSPKGFAESFGFTTHSKLFEDCRIEVDAYLIDFIASSTTAPILKSYKPVIFIDHNSPELLPEAKKLLRKRCWYIPAWDNADNRLQIDWKELKRALQAREHVFDMAFSNTYLGCY